MHDISRTRSLAARIMNRNVFVWDSEQQQHDDSRWGIVIGVRN